MEVSITQDNDFPVEAKIPKGSRLEGIESSYGPLETAVRCGLSHCGTPHKRGYVVVYVSSDSAVSERGIIGHVCGKREFKETWTQAVARHEAEVRAADIRAELDRFLENAIGVEPHLRALLPTLDIHSVIRKILLIDARDFMRQCANACRTGHGRLEGYYDHDGKKTSCKLAGQLFFVQYDVPNKAKRLLNGITQIQRLSEQPDTTVRQLKEIMSRLGNLRLAAGEIEKEAADGVAALRPANFAKAIRVLDPFETGKVRMVGTVLEVQRVLADASWTPITDLANPVMPANAKFWSGSL